MNDDAATTDDLQREQDEIAARLEGVAQADTLTPADRYGELFVAVQGASVFADSKTFVDCAPLQAPEAIMEVNIPTGTPLVYELDAGLNVISKRYLGDADEIARAQAAVANQGKAK